MALGRKTGGRQKGTPNKITGAVKNAILQAAEAADEDGMVGYLTKQATQNPVAFMSLLGRVLPIDHTNDGERFEFPAQIILRAASGDD